MKKKIIIFKNDAVGDLVQSLDAINNIINFNKSNKIIIYLSERSKNFSFLIDFENVEIKTISYNLTFIQKLQIIYNIFTSTFDKIYILSPKNFYFYLPFFFRKIKFYGICVNGNKNYQRPRPFLRKFLYKYVVNERDKNSKRKSTMEIQLDLTKDLNFNDKYRIKRIITNSNKFSKTVNNYIYFHLKMENFKKLGWGINELNIMLNEFLKYKDNVIFTRDLIKRDKNDFFNKKYNVVNFRTKTESNNNSNIFLYDAITGTDLYDVIKKADKIVAFHGMMTNLASIEKKTVLDLFLCEIKSIEDFRRYKNALYEFKPRYKNYDFIVPSRSINKTIRKMKFFLNK